jgi:hypothetical protein
MTDTWNIGYDATAAFVRKALDDAGITREQATAMTLRQLGKIPGMGPEQVDRLWMHGIHSDDNLRRHPKPTLPLNGIKRMILEVLADAGVPISLDHGFDILLAPRPRWPRLGGRRAYNTQWLATMRAWIALEKAGLIVATPDAWGTYKITAAGREALDGCG